MIAKKIILFLIVFIGFLLRAINVSDNPLSLSWDEVSIGYNAYSIIKTGRDEHGKFLPFNAFTAYGDYKPPLAVYITVPFVALLGLNELSVRLPSVIFGTLSVLLTYHLVYELFSNLGSGREQKLDVLSSTSKRLSYFRLEEFLPLTSCMLLALSPWHINLSRAGFEANIALFFVLLGLYLLTRSLRFPKLWVLGWLPFVAAVYTFNSSRYFVFIFSLMLVFLFLPYIKANYRLFIIGILLAILTTFPIIPHLLSKESRLRFVEVNIFSDPAVVITANERIGHEEYSLLAKIIHNRRVGYVRSFIGHFLDNLEPNFLFINGDGNPKFSTRDVGQLYIIEAPFLIAGIIFMFSNNGKIALFLLAWIVTAILPAATARETPHALRTLNILPAWQIYIAYGLMVFLNNIFQKFILQVRFTGIAGRLYRYSGMMAIIFVFVIYLFQLTYYVYNYHFHYPRIYAAEWQYGYKQAFDYLKTVNNSYCNVYLTDSIGRPYMYALFYTGYDPWRYLQEKKSYFDSAGFYHVESFGKYYFTNRLPADILPNSVIIGDFGWAVENNRILHRIKYPDGSDRLVVFK